MWVVHVERDSDRGRRRGVRCQLTPRGAAQAVFAEGHAAVEGVPKNLSFQVERFLTPHPTADFFEGIFTHSPIANAIFTRNSALTKSDFTRNLINNRFLRVTQFNNPIFTRDPINNPMV